MEQRKPYLVFRSIKHYLLASVITMAVANLNLMIDGILMGNFLGPDALAAINLCLPIINSIIALGTLVSAGAVLITANALGQMDRKSVNEIYTLSSLAQWVIGFLLLCFAKPLSGMLSALVCTGSELVPLCEKYIFVMLLGSVTVMYANSYGSFLEVCGYPKAVAVIMSLSVVINVFMDVLLVKVLKSDIGGAALASVIGNASSIIGFTAFSAIKKGIIQLDLHIRKPFRKLGEIIAKSIAQVIGIVAIVLLQLICNGFVQKALGPDGIFVLSIGYSILGISTMLGNGLSSTFTAIGGSMMGQGDYQGLRFLFRRGMAICILAGMAFMLVSVILPRPLAGLFGATTKELVELAAHGIPLISTFILGITILMPYATHFQVLGRFSLSSVMNLSILGSVLISFLLVSGLFPAEQIWLAFPLSCFLLLLILLIGICVAKGSSERRVAFPDLIPADEPKVRKLDLSVVCTKEAFAESMKEVWLYLENSDCGELSFRIALCVEELLLNAVMHSGGNASHYIDVLIRGDEREITVLLKDDGIPFNTSICLSEGKTNGLVMAHHFCKNIQYSYSFGQNITMMKWHMKKE